MQTVNTDEMKNVVKVIDSLIAAKGSRINKYGTVNGYASPSKIIKALKDEDGLNAWRDRVGHDVADKIMQESAARGTAMHHAIEACFDGETFDLTREAKLDYNRQDFYHFERMKPVLARLQPIRMENTLFSDKLKISGMVDCIGYFDGKLSIVDFKTSRKPKQIQYLGDYMFQVTLYSIMFYHMTGFKIYDGVLLCQPDDEDEFRNEPQVIQFNIREQLRNAAKYIQMYRNGERACVKF